MSIKLDTFNKIQSELEKNPDQSVSSIAKRLKVNPGYFYAVRREKTGVKKAKARQPIAASRLTKKEQNFTNTTRGNMVMLFGTPDQIAKVFRGSL